MTIGHDPRFNVDIYGSGSDPWMGRVGFNQLIGLITAGAVKGAQGVSGDRPTAGIDRRLYLATDTKRLFWDTGSEWVEVSPVGGGPTAAAVTVGGGDVSGSSRIAARSDHGHALAAPAADPGAEAFGSTADRGVSTTPARADHRHAMPAMPLSAVAPVANGFGEAAVVGVSTNVARADHKHATPSVVGNVSDVVNGSIPTNLGSLRFRTGQGILTAGAGGNMNISTGFSNGLVFITAVAVDNANFIASVRTDLGTAATPVFRWISADDGQPVTGNIRVNWLALGW